MSSVITDAHVNTFSAYAAAQQAVKGFAELPPDASKTFIYTSNKLHIMTLEPLISMGMGKSASAHMIHYLSEVYRSSGYKYAHMFPARCYDADNDVHNAGSITQMSGNRMESQHMIIWMLRPMQTTIFNWSKKRIKGPGTQLSLKEKGTSSLMRTQYTVAVFPAHDCVRTSSYICDGLAICCLQYSSLLFERASMVQPETRAVIAFEEG